MIGSPRPRLGVHPHATDIGGAGQSERIHPFTFLISDMSQQLPSTGRMPRYPAVYREGKPAKVGDLRCMPRLPAGSAETCR